MSFGIRWSILPLIHRRSQVSISSSILLCKIQSSLGDINSNDPPCTHRFTYCHSPCISCSLRLDLQKPNRPSSKDRDIVDGSDFGDLTDGIDSYGERFHLSFNHFTRPRTYESTLVKREVLYISKRLNAHLRQGVYSINQLGVDNIPVKCHLSIELLQTSYPDIGHLINQ